MISSTPLTHSIQGDITLPGDKSISHRALMLGAIAEGVTEITHCLHSEDTLATARALRQMGVKIENAQDKTLVYGVGLRGLSAPCEPIDCGNSGTSIRLLAGILAGQAFDSVLIGDESLSRRPMMRIIEPLKLMGAQIDSKDGYAPLNISGNNTLKAIRYTPSVASAQVKSCILLAGLYASGQTEVIEPVITRDHTERMLPFEARALQVPGDLSSAAFFMVLASLVPGSLLMMRGVGVNPTRTGVLEILKAMGANLCLQDSYANGSEPVADICVRYAPLKGIDISSDMLVKAIDEFPILMIAASLARGTTRIFGVGELRHKESDRVSAMVQGLQALGVQVLVEQEDVVIEGGALQGGMVDALHDHRIAMAFLIAGALAKAPIRVLNTAAISTSFPAFVEMANQLGCRMEEQDTNDVRA